MAKCIFKACSAYIYRRKRQHGSFGNYEQFNIVGVLESEGEVGENEPRERQVIEVLEVSILQH